jgi:hypothetical protein
LPTKKSRFPGLNWGPPPYHGGALPIELKRRFYCIKKGEDIHSEYLRPLKIPNPRVEKAHKYI